MSEVIRFARFAEYYGKRAIDYFGLLLVRLTAREVPRQLN